MTDYGHPPLLQSLQMIGLGARKLIGGALFVLSWITGMLGRILHP
jgi:hypothetical protein